MLDFWMCCLRRGISFSGSLGEAGGVRGADDERRCNLPDERGCDSMLDGGDGGGLGSAKGCTGRIGRAAGCSLNVKRRKSDFFLWIGVGCSMTIILADRCVLGKSSSVLDFRIACVVSDRGIKRGRLGIEEAKSNAQRSP